MSYYVDLLTEVWVQVAENLILLDNSLSNVVELNGT